MTVLQKFYLIFVPERHFCGVSQRAQGVLTVSNAPSVKKGKNVCPVTLLKNVALVQKSSKTSVEQSFLWDVPGCGWVHEARVVHP